MDTTRQVKIRWRRVETRTANRPSDRSQLNNEGTRLFQKACRKHQEGDIGRAEQLYRQAVQTDPTIHAAWRNLGALLRQQGKTQEARHCTEQALRLDSTDASLWGNYGNVLRDQKLLEESCKAFREGLKRAPGSKGLLQGLAISLGQRGDHRQVVELLSPVADNALIQAGHGDKVLAELLLELGNAHHALGEKDRALQRWKRHPWRRRRKAPVHRSEHCPSAVGRNGSPKRRSYAKTSSACFPPTKICIRAA